MKQLRSFFEFRAFGVCAYWGDRWGIATSSIRVFFIYATFLTFGSPIFVYLGLAFLRDLRKHFRRRRSVFFEL